MLVNESDRLEEAKMAVDFDLSGEEIRAENPTLPAAHRKKTRVCGGCAITAFDFLPKANPRWFET